MMQKLDFNTSYLLLSVFSSSILLIFVMLLKHLKMATVVIYMSVSSIMLTICYLLMDAPDVAMTEAALGACLSSTVLILASKKLNNPSNICKNIFSSKKILYIPLLVIFVIIITMKMYDLLIYGNISAELHLNVSKHYLENTKKEIGIPAFVAALLASYRGFDTLGETTVILLAGIAVLLIKKNTKNTKYLY